MKGVNLRRRPDQEGCALAPVQLFGQKWKSEVDPIDGTTEIGLFRARTHQRERAHWKSGFGAKLESKHSHYEPYRF